MFIRTALVCLLFNFSASLIASELIVKNADQLVDAINQANTGKVQSILVAPGNYQLSQRLTITHDDVSIEGIGTAPSSVIISGSEMKHSDEVGVIFDIQAKRIHISNLSLQSSSNHLIQIRAEKDADYFHLSNVSLSDSYEQMLKVSGDSDPLSPTADYGLIENCIFQYTAGVGPQYYIGGIDAHRSKNWTVRRNTFKNIASPSIKVAQYAIHFWNFSKDNIVVHNTIINSDRGIGFGMGKGENQHSGGIIAYNVIIHDDKGNPFSDVGIKLESSPETIVRGNTIIFEHTYPNAIEYRYELTQNVLIEDNVTNRKITAQERGVAVLNNNSEASSVYTTWLYLRYFLSRIL